MKKKIILLAVLLPIFSAALLAQSSPADKLNDLEHIYSNLEYKTTAYNDLKAKWYVTDPLLVRNAFNKFVVQNALRVDGKVISNSEVETKAREIFDGNVLISVRKRYYDDADGPPCCRARETFQFCRHAGPNFIERRRHESSSLRSPCP